MLEQTWKIYPADRDRGRESDKGRRRRPTDADEHTLSECNSRK